MLQSFIGLPLTVFIAIRIVGVSRGWRLWHSRMHFGPNAVNPPSLAFLSRGGCRAVEFHSIGRRAGDKPQSGPQITESPGQRRPRLLELWPRRRHPSRPAGGRDHLAGNLQRRARRQEPLGTPGGSSPVSRALTSSAISSIWRPRQMTPSCGRLSTRHWPTVFPSCGSWTPPDSRWATIRRFSRPGALVIPVMRPCSAD
jgi:hypothetical protein